VDGEQRVIAEKHELPRVLEAGVPAGGRALGRPALLTLEDYAGVADESLQLCAPAPVAFVDGRVHPCATFNTTPLIGGEGLRGGTPYRIARGCGTIGPVGKAKKPRTPAQIAAFERMREANRAKILAEAGVQTDPPAAPPADPPADPPATKPTYRARSKAKARSSSGTRRRSSPSPAPDPAPASSSGGGFLQGLREGLGT